MTFHVLPCNDLLSIVMFHRVLRVFFGEIHVTGDKLIYNHVWVENVQANIPKDHPRVLENGPKVVPKTIQDSPTHTWQSTPRGLVDAPLVVSYLFRH